MQELLSVLNRLRALGIAVLMLSSFCGALVLAWKGITIEEEAREQLASALDLARDAMEAKFLAADFNGWQTAYALDIARRTPEATDDDAASRARFLGSAASFGAKLRAMKQERLTPDEQSEIIRLERDFQEFMDIDKTVIAAYRQGSSRAMQQADDLVLGREIEIFHDISRGITRVTDSIAARANLASQAASLATSRSRWLFVGAAAATFLLVISCVSILVRSLIQQSHLLARIDALTYIERRGQGADGAP
jgi:methyl-accepting chemotaxis protein